MRENPSPYGLRNGLGLVLLRSIKYRLRAIAPSVLFLVITAYFGWNVVHGTSGLQAQAVQRAQLAQAQQSLAAVNAQLTQWQTRVQDLSGPSIAGDMLDGQARAVLNLANPNDLVVELPQNKPAK